MELHSLVVAAVPRLNRSKLIHSYQKSFRWAKNITFFGTQTALLLNVLPKQEMRFAFLT